MTQLFMVQPDLLSGLVRPAQVGAAVAPHIRLATGQDAEPLAGLMRDAYQEDWDAARVRRELLDADDVPATWVIDDGTILATASERYLPDRFPAAGYLHYVAARPDRAGQGLGSLITQQVLGQVVARGLTRCVLETDDFRIPALIVYLRLGFIPEYRSDAERLAWSAVFPRLVGSRRMDISEGMKGQK